MRDAAFWRRDGIMCMSANVSIICIDFLKSSMVDKLINRSIHSSTVMQISSA